MHTKFKQLKQIIQKGDKINLIDYNVNYINTSIENFECYDLSQGSIDVDKYTEISRTLLHEAIKANKPQVVYTLLQQKADVDIPYVERDYKKTQKCIVHYGYSESVTDTDDERDEPIDFNDETKVPVGYTKDGEANKIFLTERKTSTLDLIREYCPKALQYLIKNVDERLQLSLKSLFEFKPKKKKMKKLDISPQREISDEINGIEEADEGYASDIEFFKQLQVEERFFNPKRNKQAFVKKIAGALQKRRLGKNSPRIMNIKSAAPARQFITAEKATMKASLQCVPESGFYSYFDNHLRWEKAQRYRNGRYSPYFCADETIRFDDSKVTYRQKAVTHYNHLGDYYLYDIGTYKDIFEFLYKLVRAPKPDIIAHKEKQLAELILKFTKNGKRINLKKLKKIYLRAKQNDVDGLNAICYHCFVKEITRWQYPRNKLHELPFAIAQGRSLQLIAKGYLSLNKVFDQNSKYGIFTGKNIGANIDSVKKKIKNINRLYREAILKPKNHDQFIGFFVNCPKGKIVTKRKALRNELINVYGGDKDTDGEGYSSEEDIQKDVMKV